MNSVKKSIFIGCALVCGFCLATASIVAQQHETSVSRQDVPAPVLAAFAKAYPNAVIKGYSKEVENGKTAYEIECMEGKTHRDVTFDPDGKLILVEQVISFRELPVAVQQAVNARFPKARIHLVEKLTADSKQTYELQLRHAGKSLETSFDAAGKELETRPATKD